VRGYLCSAAARLDQLDPSNNQRPTCSAAARLDKFGRTTTNDQFGPTNGQGPKTNDQQQQPTTTTNNNNQQQQPTTTTNNRFYTA